MTDRPTNNRRIWVFIENKIFLTKGLISGKMTRKLLLPLLLYFGPTLLNFKISRSVPLKGLYVVNHIISLLFFYYWKCYFPMAPYIRRLVCQMVGRSVLKGHLYLYPPVGALVFAIHSFVKYWIIQPVREENSANNTSANLQREFCLSLL